ncbi:hypothetical protein GE21DRAFT_1124022 [Neurospora crassa]|nr:hypothetical protein GE21DRAFT_1124022 [Neurospora crassa]
MPESVDGRITSRAFHDWVRLDCTTRVKRWKIRMRRPQWAWMDGWTDGLECGRSFTRIRDIQSYTCFQSAAFSFSVT